MAVLTISREYGSRAEEIAQWENPRLYHIDHQYQPNVHAERCEGYCCDGPPAASRNIMNHSGVWSINMLKCEE